MGDMQRVDPEPFRLTSLAHGGGCGCKLSPAVLRDLLADQPAMSGFPDLLVGTETGDDAAAYAREVVKADFEEAGHEDVVRKVAGDLGDKATADEIRVKMEQLLKVAKGQLVDE